SRFTETPRRGTARTLGLESRPPARRHGAHTSTTHARTIHCGHASLGRGRHALSNRRCLKCNRTWIQSVPPAVAGGYVVDALEEFKSMATFQLTVNGQRREVNVDPSTPLLWVLREDLKMTGTKFGCGISACGACTVHVDGVATRSCIVPISHIGDRPVITIEGIGNDAVGRAVQA